MKRLIALSVVILLAGCAGTPQVRSKVALAISCSTYAQVLSQLTPLRAAGRLSASTIGRVSATNDALRPICASGSDFDPAKGIDAVERAIGLIRTIKEDRQ